MNKNIKIILGLIVAVLVVWGIYSISQKPSEPMTNEPIKIGVITGLTGDYAFVGENYKKGIMLASELYKKANPDNFIELIIEDDGFDAKKGLSAYKKLINIDKIDVLINMTTPTINAIYDLVVKNGMPVIQGGEQSREPINDNIFQIMPGNIFAEIKLGEYVKGMNLEKIAVVYNNDTTFLRFIEGFRQGYDGEFDEYKLGSVGLGNVDYRTITTKLLTTKPSAIVLIAIPNDGAKIIQEIFKLSKDKPLFIFDGNFHTGFSDYQKIFNDMNIFNGDIVSVFSNKTNDKFINEYKNKYSEEPGVAVDWAYDSFNLLMETYNPDNEKWIENIKKADFEGAGGNIVFDEYGVRIPEFEIKIIENGKL